MQAPFESGSAAGRPSPPAAAPAVVTVMITAHNRPEELRATLRELRRQRYPSLELLVIDDASARSLEPVVRAEWPDARFHRNPRNLGLIGSRSLGMTLAGGDYILTLDDDSAPVDPDDIARAVRRFEREPRLGVLTFRIHEGLEPPPPAEPQSEQYMHSYIGCGHMMRSEVVRSVGSYRDFFVYYGEEGEYAVRVIDQGWSILFFPDVVVHHRLSPLNRSEGKITAYNLRNNLWTILLNVPFPRAAGEFSWKLMSYGMEIVRRGELRWGAWAIGSFAAGLPRVLRERKPVSPAGLRTYDALRFRRIDTAQALAEARPPSAGERWEWFRTVWLKRRRGRGFWDRRPGGIGKSRWGTEAEE
jgi:GT2 family glycosyltransferase